MKKLSPSASAARAALLPLGALAAGFALAQTPPAANADQPTVLPAVKVKAQAEPQGKNEVQATTTTIGKGNQELRDIPQSITVVTERLIDDRNLDTLKETLKNTAGITFLAAEGGEEDIRLRGFALQSTGDVFVDGLRDPAFYERDTFFMDRIEVLRGSASMLFGRGSTGGAVNQVSKVARTINEGSVEATVASHNYLRVVGDVNRRIDDNSALRIGVMNTVADNNGAGSSINKTGVAGTYRTGIGERDELSVSFSHLDNKNGMNYGLPWIKPTPAASVDQTTTLPLDPTTYYGMASDLNAGTATTATATHTHRFGVNSALTTKVRLGDYTRDQRAGTVRLCGPSVNSITGAITLNPACPAQTVPVSLQTFGDASVVTRGTQLKIQDLQTAFVQSDYSGRFSAIGMRHEVLAGVDAALEKKTVYAARSAAQGGVNLTKPTTTIGSPDDGASLNEASRVLRVNNDYTSTGVGAYAQDLIALTPTWKLLLGLRFDKLKGEYNSYAIPTNAAGPEISTSYTMNVSEWSKRAGVLYQPSERLSFHLSGATSFNTSGDAYSLSAANVDIPPEQSINLELGGRWESEDGKFSVRAAAFRSTKLHERNTDPLVNLVTLSGKRHVAGAELDLAGRITPQWEVFGSYMWLPVANIDIGVEGSEGQGTRPSLTPHHSGTIWTTYQITPTIRLGGGLNARSAQTPNRNPGWAAESFVTADLMAEWVVVPNQFKLKANLSNVANKLYADQLYSGHYIPGPGRTVAVTGTYSF